MKIPAIGINDDSSVNSEKNSIPLIYVYYNVMVMIIMMLVMKGMMLVISDDGNYEHDVNHEKKYIE